MIFIETGLSNTSLNFVKNKQSSLRREIHPFLRKDIHPIVRRKIPPIVHRDTPPIVRRDTPPTSKQVSSARGYCPEPEPTDNGKVMVIGKGHGATAIYKCSKGYYGRNLHRKCNDALKWSGDVPVCLHGKCVYIYPIHNYYTYILFIKRNAELQVQFYITCYFHDHPNSSQKVKSTKNVYNSW